jgi:hypothetical protein
VWAVLASSLLVTATAPGDAQAAGDEEFYRRAGGFAAFAEVVRLGAKKLALSAPMTPAEMDEFMPEAERIANENGVKMYRETDFLVTDLFPADVAEGKHVILIYNGGTLDEYLALKEIKAVLVEAKRYEGHARAEVARVFGHLLSYPDPVIDRQLADHGRD